MTDANDRSAATSGPTDIARLIALRLSRRDVLRGVAGLTAFGLFGCATSGPAPATGPGAAPGPAPALAFAEIGRFLDETHHLAAGYRAQVLLRGGDPVVAGAPAFRPGQQTADDQERQFGMDNDFIGFMPLPRGSTASDRGLLCVNHERNTPHLAWPGMTPANYRDRMTRDQAEAEMASQGHTVVEIRRQGPAWAVVSDSPYNRRINARSTRMAIGGPARGHPRMRTSEDPAGEVILGTLNNCAGGKTPWGTVLTCEENIHNMFSGDPASVPGEAAALARYRITGRERYTWGRFHARFNLNREPHEPNRFGWVVEIDPYDPASTPVKRTALGRCKHEGATSAVSHDGRVAVYTGDDEWMEYVYKFVTRDRFDPARPQANRDLLDHGTLFAARFEADGAVRWLPLVHGQGPLVAANGFGSQADVVIEARRAADLLGATKMDRPEDIETNPRTGRVYVVCTFNERRKAEEIDAANPRGPNRYGHIIEIVPPDAGGRPDHTATTGRWEFFLLGGNPADPAHGAKYHAPVSSTGWLCAPDNVAFDPHGRIWIATDGQDDWAGFADSVYAAQTEGPQRGAPRAFFSGPRGCELCGPEFTPDGRTFFIAVQHPGDEKGSTFDKPSTRWPDFQPGMPPRPSVLAITKDDGGEIGS